MSSLDERRAREADAKAAAAARVRERLEAGDGKPRWPLRDLEARHRRAAQDHRDAPARRESDTTVSNIDRMLEVRQAGEVALHRRDEAVVQAGRLLDKSFDDAAADKLLRFAGDAVRLDRLASGLGEVEERMSARVAWEPGPYDEGSPNSWVLDQLAVAPDSAAGSAAAAGAQGRLARHGQDVRRAIQAGNEYGHYAERVIRAGHRRSDGDERLGEQQAGEELRALTTGGGTTAAASAGGAFVAPLILWSSWAAYRSPYWTFAGQLAAADLPGYGMMVYLPSFSAGTSVTAQTEAGAVSETDPVSTLTGYPVKELAGQITVTQQYLDRAGPGIQGDVVLYRQLKDQLAAQVDGYAVGQAIAGAQAVTNTGTFALDTAGGEGGFLKNLKTAKSLLTDTAGVRVRATHLFAQSDFADYLMALADSQGRPVFEPTLSLPTLQASGQGTDPEGDGHTGYTIGGLAMFADDNIPESGSNLQLVVARPSTILLATSEPTTYLFDQSSGLSTSLEALVGVRQYAVCVPRFPTGVSVITGAAYAASGFAG